VTSFGLLGIFHLKKIQSDTFSQDNIIVLLRDVFHIGLVIGPRPTVLA
jgi:hypothetical protein